MGIPITINGHELTVNDMNVEPNAEYLVTVGDTANSVTVERDDLRVENARLCEKVTLLEMDKRGLKACYDNLSRQHADLEAENAKLRELLGKACWLIPRCAMPNTALDGLANSIVEDAEKLGIPTDG